MTVGPPAVPIVESSINLTCTVELSQLVDVPVTVTTEWTGPAGFMTSNTAQPVMGSEPTTYTSTASMVNASMSGRERSGNYTCKATVRAMTTYLIDSVGHVTSSRVIVGKVKYYYNCMCCLSCSYFLYMSHHSITTPI